VPGWRGGEKRLGKERCGEESAVPAATEGKNGQEGGESQFPENGRGNLRSKFACAGKGLRIFFSKSLGRGGKEAG